MKKVFHLASDVFQVSTATIVQNTTPYLFRYTKHFTITFFFLIPWYIFDLTGEYQNKVGKTKCTECSIGQYRSRDDTNLTHCVACPSGTSSSLPGVSKCVDCIPGQYQNKVGKRNCTECSIGQYRSRLDKDSTHCVDCPKGFFSSSKGVAQCVDCIPGQYQNEVGKTKCTECKIGQYRSRREKDLTKCVDCPRGTSSNLEGVAKCVECIPGKYQDIKGQSSCIPCAVNTASSESSRKTPCNQVQAGSIVLGGTISVQVPAGSYLSNCSNEACTGFEQCPSGWYGSKPASRKCNACKAGLTSSDAATACKSCVKGKFGAKRKEEGGGVYRLPCWILST